MQSPAKAVSRDRGIKSIGVIVDLDRFQQAERFSELITDFNLQPNALKVIGYKEFYDKNSPYATPVFSDKDLGWKGAIENSYALEFLGREYDLLVNYYDEENLMLQLMTIKSRARINVGFSQVDKNLNDLILQVPLQDFKVFKEELHKYLKVLNELD